MRQLRFIGPTCVLFVAICYAVSLAADTEVQPSSLARGEAPVHEDAHEGHDNAQDHDRHHDEHHDDLPSSGDFGAAGGHDEHGNEEHGAIRLDTETTKEFGIDVEAAAPGVLVLHTTLPGEVQVNQDQTAHIVPRYPGLVIEVRKTIGDDVQKGDVLAVLEGNESLAPYDLKSLIGGKIIEKHITLGESLNEDDVSFTVSNLGTVWIDLTLYQKDILSVKKGQKVVISGGEHLPTAEGKISYISPTVDKHTRTGHARVVLPNPKGTWKPGLFVTGHVQTAKRRVNVLVPAGALQSIDGNVSVFVETNEGFELRPIEIGQRNRARVEVVSGLQPGERYVRKGGFTLKAEMARGELEHAGHAH